MNISFVIYLVYLSCIGHILGFWFSPKSVFDDEWVHFRLYTRSYSLFKLASVENVLVLFPPHDAPQLQCYAILGNDSAGRYAMWYDTCVYTPATIVIIGAAGSRTAQFLTVSQASSLSVNILRATSKKGEVFGRDVTTVTDSQFDPMKPTKIFLHGWFAAGWNWYIKDLRLELLENEDVNFIEVDWSLRAVNPNYLQAKVSAQDAGMEAAKLLTWLSMFFDLNLKDVHAIGHSLGGQACGALGRELQNPKIGRISGLDPAQPGFDLSDPDDTLGPEDADFVDVLHTTITAEVPMGHVDFYPNNGELGIRYLTWFHSHMQAMYIYTETVNSKCSFTAYKCDDFDQLLDGLCPTTCDEPTSCNRMGYHASPHGAMGNLQLEISESYPYC